MVDRNNFFRGPIIPGIQNFHMIATIEAGTELSKIPDFLKGIPSSGGNVLRDIKYMLCTCYSTDKKNNIRTTCFWSSDPSDFVFNFNQNARNDGPALLRLGEPGGNSFPIEVHGRETGNNIISNYKNIKQVDLTSSPLNMQSNAKTSTSFVFTQTSFNLPPNDIFVNCDYTIETITNQESTTSTNPINWAFRKYFNSAQKNPDGNIIIDSNSSYTSTELFKKTPVVDPFLPTNVPKINFGTTPYNITHIGDKKQFTFPVTASELPRFNLISLTNGVIKFIDSTSSSNFMYLHYTAFLLPQGGSGGSVTFTYKQDSDLEYYGERSIITSGSSKPCKIEYELRNSLFGFDFVKTSTDDWLKIQLIPATDSAIFPGQLMLSNNSIYTTEILKPKPTSSYTIYDTTNGKNSMSMTDLESNFSKIFFREFSTFYSLVVMGSWPTSGTEFWTTNFETGHQNITISPTTTTSKPRSTIFCWTSSNLANYIYAYSYCSSSQTCSYCYGNGPRSSKCIPTDNTTKNVVQTNLGTTSNPPFVTPMSASTNKENGISEITKNEYTFIWISFGIFAIIAIAIVAVLGYFNNKQYYQKDTKDEEGKTIVDEKGKRIKDKAGVDKSFSKQYKYNNPVFNPSE